MWYEVWFCEYEGSFRVAIFPYQEDAEDYIEWLQSKNSSLNFTIITKTDKNYKDYLNEFNHFGACFGCTARKLVEIEVENV